MEGLLTELTTTRLSEPAENVLTEVIKIADIPSIPSNIEVSSPESVLEALRGQPDFNTLSASLKWLTTTSSKTSANGFSITRPSPLSAQIINALVSEIIPVYWASLNEKVPQGKNHAYKHKTERICLLNCLKSTTGLNALLLRSKSVISQKIEPGQKKAISDNASVILAEQQDILQSILQDDITISLLWDNIVDETSVVQRSMLMELSALLCGGKLINVAAETDTILRDSSDVIVDSHWIADGPRYSRWLGRNFRTWAQQTQDLSTAALTAFTILLNKALRLGYSDIVLDEILSLVLGSENDVACIRTILNNLSKQDQKLFIDAAIKLLSKKFSLVQNYVVEDKWYLQEKDIVGAAARYLNILTNNVESRKAHLISWLTSPTGAGLGEKIGIRRAVIASLATFKTDIETVFDRALDQFGDQLYIKHTPVLQQEVHTQVLLMAAGHVSRISKLKLAMSIRSGPYLNAVSNHLSATTPRIRFLGMIVGEAISGLIEKEDKAMKFKIDELETPEALWYKSLVNIQDLCGSLEVLRNPVKTTTPTKNKATKASPKIKAQQARSKIISIEEIEDDEEPPDNVVPYPKLDSDPEDSDEDATLVVRDKPRAPVYIRDLIAYLRDTESYDKQKLGLTTASNLIRRKTTFGTEVTAHAIELASLLVGLQNKYSIPDFQDHRLQSMLAIVLADPMTMAPWFITTFFNGDYSVSQRASILTVLSLSARELAGLFDQDKSITTVPPPASPFPSKTLPPRMHAIYASTPDTSQIDALSTSLYQSMVAPLAASAADKVTGPNILKVRTFSSRLSVESRRSKPKANILQKYIADSYFLPLTARFNAHLHSYGRNSSHVLFSSILLTSLLKTLSLIYHAAGPTTPTLPTLTSEFWELVIAVQYRALEDREIGQAVLIAYLTILDVNSERDTRSFVEAFGKRLNETQRWCNAYFEGLGRGSAEDDRLRSLAAAVLVKIGEVVEGYQALLIGVGGGGL